MTNTLYERPGDYDFQYVDYVRDLPFWEWLATTYAGNKPIGEFACGTGRVTLHLSTQGYDIVGVDLSTRMLDLCRQKLALRDEEKTRKFGKVDLHEGDMCTFQTGEKHSLVFVPFTSFLHVLGTDNQLAALRNFHSHLEPSGHLVVDIFQPNVERLTAGLRHYSAPTYEKRIQLPNGDLLVRYQTTRYFPATQQAEWVFYVEIYDGTTNDMTRKYTEEARIQAIFPIEWRLLLRTAGFEIVTEFGDFDRTPFGDTSPRMLFVAKKI